LDRMMKVAVIGGGMMGLASAFYLSNRGCHVTVFEKTDEIGGLSRSEEFLPGFRWDRFYHVILSTDSELLAFVDEIGLSLDVRFTETKTGFFTDGKLHSMSSTSEFIKFKPLSLWDKFRLGFGILYASRIRNSSRLEQVYARNWLVTVFGRRVYEKIWDPLLRSKLGGAKNQASGRFIWSCITRYYGTREKTSKKEMMGVVKGGYHAILNQTKDILARKGVAFHLSSGIRQIRTADGREIVLTDDQGNNHHFDKALATIPSPEISKICPDMPAEFHQLLDKIDYLSLICVVLVLKKSYCPYYVTNLTDAGFPFTGFIDATNIIPSDILEGRALVYLPKYIPQGDPFYSRPDSEVTSLFIQGMQRIFPQMQSSDILASAIFREKYVQPIQKVGYSHTVPDMETPMENLFMANTTMILNSTLNNNQVIKIAREATGRIMLEKS